MIVGTAGHVDHGKTTLVRALTGVDTDRMAEEKRRGITIDLGFAYMRDAAGGTIGFIDVPGHESLVRTMVAGAAGIDFALLTIAADEGIMPQTREHLDILKLLGIADGIVAVTKSDRADEARRIALARELAAALDSSVFAGKPVLFVSAANGEGMDSLRSELLCAASADRSPRLNRVFRLAVDRAFTLKGVGTVVAGTAISGRVAVGDEVTIMPDGRRARVRSLHVQNVVAAEGLAGTRCALALVGVPREAVARGDWICGEPEPATSARFDVDLHVLASERRGVGHGTPVHLHCGASDVPARVVALSEDVLTPGTSGFAQIVATAPLPLRHGDRFVLRDTSAQRTIAGGIVVDPRGLKRKRRATERLQRLAAMGESDTTAALTNVLALPPHAENLGVFAADRSLTIDAAEASASAMGCVICRDTDAVVVTSPARLQALADTCLAHLAAVHAESPELTGLAAERLRSLLGPAVPRPLFAAVHEQLLEEGRVTRRGPYLCLPTHVARLGAEDRRIAELLLPLVALDRFRPPRVRDLGEALGFHEAKIRHACRALVRTGVLVEIAKDHFFLHETVAEMAAIALDLTESRTLFTAADFRDRLDNGRKVAIQILEFFDRQGLTRRNGDLRRVVKPPDAFFGTGRAPTSDAA